LAFVTIPKKYHLPRGIGFQNPHLCMMLIFKKKFFVQNLLGSEVKFGWTIGIFLALIRDREQQAEADRTAPNISRLL
jgi:hypothetical protein